LHMKELPLNNKFVSLGGPITSMCRKAFRVLTDPLSREKYLQNQPVFILVNRHGSIKRSHAKCEHVESSINSTEGASCVKQFGQAQISNQNSSYRTVSRGICIVLTNGPFPLKLRMYQLLASRIPFQRSIMSMIAHPMLAYAHLSYPTLNGREVSWRGNP